MNRGGKEQKASDLCREAQVAQHLYMMTAYFVSELVCHRLEAVHAQHKRLAAASHRFYALAHGEFNKDKVTPRSCRFDHFGFQKCGPSHTALDWSSAEIDVI